MEVPWRAQVQSPRTHRQPVAVVARQTSPSPVVAEWSYSRSLPVGGDGVRRRHLPEAPVLRTQVKKEVDGVVQKLTKTGRVTIGIVALDTLRRWLSEEAQASFTVFHVEVCCTKCIQSTEKKTCPKIAFSFDRCRVVLMEHTWSGVCVCVLHRNTASPRTTMLS